MEESHQGALLRHVLNGVRDIMYTVSEFHNVRSFILHHYFIHHYFIFHLGMFFLLGYWPEFHGNKLCCIAC